MSSVRPILFSAPMIRALLAGRKTQTRRLASSATKRYGIKGRDHFATHTPSPRLKQINGQPDWCVEMISIEHGLWHPETNTKGSSAWYAKSPWGGPGDLLWVRETWKPIGMQSTCTGPDHVYFAASDDSENDDTPWKPSIFMPRWASRLTLAITDVRIERLQSISEADAEAEGVKKVKDHCYVVEGFGYDANGMGLCHSRPSIPYAQLWDHINGAGAWDANPWVVALTFTIHRQNIAAYLSQRSEAA